MIILVLMARRNYGTRSVETVAEACADVLLMQSRSHGWPLGPIP